MKENNKQSLFTAIKKDDTLQLKQLINSGVKLEERDDKGRTPLMIAAYENKIAAARILIDAGADVNAQDDILNSPFLYAGAAGQLEILRLCLNAGADFNIYNRYGGTALIPACEKGHIEIVRELLKQKNFPIDHINRLGWTGLLEAIILTDGSPVYVEIIQMLINAGANVNLADNKGVSPLEHARKRGHHATATILLKAGAK